MQAIRRAANQLTLASVTLAGFWVACVSTFHLHEMLVGLGAVALSAAFTFFVVRTLPLRFRPSLRSLLDVRSVPWSILSDSLLIAVVLLRDLLGRPAGSHFRSAHYRYDSNSGRDTAQRTLAIAFTNLAPNFIIIGIDTRRQQVLFHQLKKTRVPAMTQRLGAEDGP